MAAPSNIPGYFRRAFPGGFRGRISRLLNSIVGWLLRTIVRLRKSFRVGFSRYFVVTGFDLMQEVFSRPEDFPTPNDSKTAAEVLDWDPPYLLALRTRDAEFEAMHALTRTCFADEALLATLPQIARDVFTARLPDPDPDTEFGEIDLAWDYTYQGFLDIVERYHGVIVPRDGENDVEFVCALLTVAGFFFSRPVPSTKPGVREDAKEAFDFAWKTVEDQVRHWMADPTNATGAMKIAVDPATNPDPARLTSMFLGMILGFIPTNGNGHARILEMLFKHPGARHYADQFASVQPDPYMDGQFLAVLHECLRMNYILPGLWREAPRTTTMGVGSEQPQWVPAGSYLLVSGMAAMHDPDHLDKPRDFRPDRSYWSYMNYGHQLHFCVGWDLSNIIFTEYFRALIVRNIKLKPGGKNVLRSLFPWQIDALYTAPGGS